MAESRKFRDLGYRCLAQYADQRLGIAPRRARELCQAGRVLLQLTKVDRACREGKLCWTMTELLTHGVAEHEQDVWLERAARVSCSELTRMLSRHRKGLSPDRERDGGLPRSEIEMHGSFSSELAAKIEKVREDLMRRRGTTVDDSEVLNHIVEKYVLPKSDPEKDAERAAACEQEETPDWLRRDVLARDGHTCQACGRTEQLHAHHIEFRSHGGPTRRENLAAVCGFCHALIHEGRLFAKGRAPHIEFRNRFGDLLRGAAPAARLPDGFLELLLPEPKKSGGQPPRREATKRVPPRFLSEDEIPENFTSEWFVAHMHLFDCGSDGTWRISKSARR